MQPIDHHLWAYCMMNESKPPPKFNQADFNVSASLILGYTFGITVCGILLMKTAETYKDISAIM